MASLHHSTSHDGWSAAEGTDAASGHSSAGSRAMMLYGGVPSSMELAVPVPSSLEIRDQVNGFLAKLPLGVTRRDAELEDCIAAHLHDLLNTRADVQLKLNQWVGVALGLQQVVERQHAELARLHQAQRAKHAQQPQHSLQQVQQQRVTDAARPDQAADALGRQLAVQHAELAQMRAQMASLRRDLLAAARHGTGPGSGASSAPDEAQGRVQGALEEQLRARTAEVQSAREEATRLRRALVDAELELQRVTSRQPAKPGGEQAQDRARLAAEALAAQHRPASLQECARRQAAIITHLRAQLAGAEPAADKGEGSPQDAIGELTARRQALEQEVQRLQANLEAAAAEREQALSGAQTEQQALKQAAEALQTCQAEALAAERAQKDALAQEFQAFREAVQARQEGLVRQLAADNAAAEQTCSLRRELELERRHCSVLEAALTESQSLRSGLERQLSAARSQLDEMGTALETARDELASLKVAVREEVERERQRREALEQAIDQGQAVAEEERERSEAEACQLRQELAELARQAGDHADIIADLTGRLAASDASWQAHHRAAILDLQAAHSEELEGLQGEHALELASLTATAEADREHGAAVAAALRCARFGPPGGGSAAASDAVFGMASEEECIVGGSTSNARADCGAAERPHKASQTAQKKSAGADSQDAGLDAADSAAGDVAAEDQSLSGQMEVVSSAQRGEAEASPARWLLAMLAAAALTSARPMTSARCRRRPRGLSPAGGRRMSAGSSADAACSVTLGGAAGPAVPAALGPSGPEAGGNIVPGDAAALSKQDAEPGSFRAASNAPGSADGQSELLLAAQECQQDELAAMARQQGAAEMDAAVWELRQRLAHEHAAEVAALQTQHEGVLAEQLTMIKDAHHRALTAMRMVHQHDLDENVGRLVSEKRSEMADLCLKNEAALVALEDRLSGEHAAEVAGLERAHRDAEALLKEQTALRHSAELVELRDSLGSRHKAEFAALKESSRSHHESELGALRDSLRSCHEAELAALKQQHKSALAEQEAVQESKNRADLAELRECHEAQLEELQKGHCAEARELRKQQEGDLDGIFCEMEGMRSRHEAESAALAAEHASQLGGVEAGLLASHEADLAALREEQEVALAAIRAELQIAHEAELSAVTQQLEERREAELLALLARQFEAGVTADAKRAAQMSRLRAYQEAELAVVRERLATAQRDAAAAAALQAELGEEHRQAMQIMAAEHAAAFAQLREELPAKHGQEVCSMEAEHAAAIAEIQERLPEAQPSQAEFACTAAQHAAELAQLQEEHSQALDSLAAEHEAALVQLHEEHSQKLRSIEAEHAAAAAQLQEELAEEHNRVELQSAVMEDLVASVRVNCDERVQRYKAKLAEANEALQAAQQLQQTQLQQQREQELPEAQDDFVLRRRDFRPGTPLNRGWQTERKPNIRLAMAQLEADNADLLARCAAAETAAGSESRAAEALRRENLELAAELAEAGEAGRAAADAAQNLHEQLAAALLGSASASVSGEAGESPSQNRHASSAPPDLAAADVAAGDVGKEAAGQMVPDIAASGSPDLSRLPAAQLLTDEDLEEGDSGRARHEQLESVVTDLTQRCQALQAENLRLQEQVGEALGEELMQLQGACLSLRGSNQDLAARLAAAAGGDACGDAVAEEDNAALRRALAELDARLAAAAAENERLRDENLELSAAVAANSCDAAELLEMAETLEERDAVEADLRARIADLVALGPAPGNAPETGHPSQVPKLVAAQLRIEALEAQLHEASAGAQERQDKKSICSRCGEALRASAESPGQASPNPAGASNAPDSSLDPSSSRQADAVDAAAAGAGGLVVAGEGGSTVALGVAHAAEVASMQEASCARTQALEEHLHSKEDLLERQREALEAAAEQLADRQEALLECQDMVAELQAFSEAQQGQLHSLQQELQAAQGKAEEARAVAGEAEEQLVGQQRRAQEAARQLAEAEQKLAMREGTLQELTLENQRLQLELSETRGQLRASRAACAETCDRVELLAARLAAAHNAKPGNSLSATGSASIVKALQGAGSNPNRDMVVRVPSRPASPAAAADCGADVGVGNADVSNAEAHAASVAAGDPGQLSAEFPPLLAGFSAGARGNASERAAASDWDSDQENDGGHKETYSLGVTARRNRHAARTARGGQATAAITIGPGESSAQLSSVPDSCTPPKPPFASLHHNVLFGESGSPSSPDSFWARAARQSQLAETPTPLRSCDNPVRSSCGSGSPLRGSQSSPLRTRRSVRGGCGSPLRAKTPRRDSMGSPLRGAGPVRDSGGSPLRTRSLPRRSKSGPFTGGGGSMGVVAAQRSLFLSPPPALPSPPDGIRDIAGRWHGTPPPQWGAA